MGKRYPLKAVRTLKEKKRVEEKKFIPFRENLLGSIRPFPEPIEFFVLRAILSYGRSPRKGGVSTKGETLAKEFNLERSDYVFDRQPDAFRSGRAHQWLSGDLTGENFFKFLT